MAQKRRGARAWWRTRASRWLGLAFIALGVFLTVSLLTYDPGAYHAAWERHAVRFGGADEIAAFADEWHGPSGPLSGLAANAGGSLGVLSLHPASRTLRVDRGRSDSSRVPRVGMESHARSPGSPPRLAQRRRDPAGRPRSPRWPRQPAPPCGGESWASRSGPACAKGSAGSAALSCSGVATIGFGVFEAEAWDGRWGNLSRALLLGLGRTLRWLTIALGVTLRWIAIALGRTLRWLAIVFGRLLRWLGIRTGRGLHAGGRASVRAAQVAVPAVGRGSVAAARYVLHRGWESGVSVDGGNGTVLPPVRPEVVRPPAPAPAEASASALPRIVDPAAEEAARRTEISDPVIARGKRADVEMRDVEDAVLEARRQVRPGSHTPPPLYKPQHGKVVIPGTEILDDVPEVGPPVAEEELLDNSRTLTETLREFGVTGRVGEVHPGPVITRYEYVPGPGVKVSQILNRQDDLALKLRASRIRIIAPIPGKAAVGVEVPNRNPAPIFLRRLLETRAFQETTGPLPLALGRDIGGAPVITELSRMPHLLIAGTTGSGKSVCMNALITSLLLKRTPEELRLLMIDPKMLELPMYNGIPHLLTEVVTDPRIAVRSLKWLLLEMERRYRVLSARNCRNILSYNMKIEKEGPIDEGEEKLPYIVVLVDELADLMITSGKEVEEPIARLAQTARAVGIHLIIATQRPSVDVITGVIKANFPSRIAFQVATRTDSRTILDQNGAESLLGKGDMLYLPPGQAAPLRVHGAFVSETETLRLAEAWRAQGEAQAHPDLEDALAEPEASAAGGMEDARFEDAARLVVVSRTGLRFAPAEAAQGGVCSCGSARGHARAGGGGLPPGREQGPRGSGGRGPPRARSRRNPRVIRGRDLARPPPALLRQDAMTRIAFITLGCPKNQVDSEVMLGRLDRAGFSTTADLAEADAAVVNTCAFLESAVQESIDTILDVASYKKRGRLKKLVVAGCLSDRYRDDLLRELPEIDAIMSTRDVGRVVEVVNGLLAPDKKGFTATADDVDAVYGDPASRVLSTGPVSPYLKISEGCGAKCTFCIIPQLRGPQRSRSVENIVAEARVLAENGAKELVLIAQDLTAYGMDLHGAPVLARLLRELETVDGVRWIRLMYANPFYWTEDLIDALATGYEGRAVRRPAHSAHRRSAAQADGTPHRQGDGGGAGAHAARARAGNRAAHERDPGLSRRDRGAGPGTARVPGMGAFR